MDTLDKYLIKELLMYFIFILFSLGILFVAIDFLSRFWSLGMPLAKILELYGYKIPGALQQFVPVASLMATLLVLSMMSRQNEVLALFAGGVGHFRIISTFLATVACISTVAFLVFDPLVPMFEKKRVLLERGQDTNEENIINLNKTKFWYRSGRVIYNVGQFDPATNTLRDASVFFLTPNFEIIEKYYAPKAEYRGDDWELSDGFSVKYPADTHFPLAQTFKTQNKLIPEKPSDYKTLEVQDETMRLKDLRRYINRNTSFGLDTIGHQVSYHKRVAVIFTPLVLVLLGISFAMKPLKNSPMTRSIGFCFFVVFIYFLISHMAAAVGKGGHIPPVIAGWGPNVVFILIASYILGRRK